MTIALPPGPPRAAGLIPALLLALSLAVAPRARAQSDRDGLPAGTRVRVVVGPAVERYTGTVFRYAADTLALAAGHGAALVQIPVSRLRWVEVGEGRDRVGWTVRGGGLGGLVGGLLGAVIVGQDHQADLAPIAGFIAGGILGVVGGGILGAIVAPERWRPLSLTGMMR